MRVLRRGGRDVSQYSIWCTGESCDLRNYQITLEALLERKKRNDTLTTQLREASEEIKKAIQCINDDLPVNAIIILEDALSSLSVEYLEYGTGKVKPTKEG